MTSRFSIAWTGLLLAIANLAALLAPASGAVRLPLVLAFACLGPGAAIIGHGRISDPVVAWAMTLVLSLTLYAGLSAIMVWVAWWRPETTQLTLAALVTASCLVALFTPALAGRHRISAR